jgi:hypothetical protein
MSENVSSLGMRATGRSGVAAEVFFLTVEVDDDRVVDLAGADCWDDVCHRYAGVC